MLKQDQKEKETMRTNENKNIVPLPSRSHSLLLCFLAGVGLLFFSTNAFAMQASWYSNASLVKEGTWKNGIERRMANGERFDETKLTCATRLYPLGVYLRIRNNGNGKSVIVKVTDRIGKRFANSRIDLSKMAFSRISELEKGVIPISVEEVK